MIDIPKMQIDEGPVATSGAPPSTPGSAEASTPALVLAGSLAHAMAPRIGRQPNGHIQNLRPPLVIRATLLDRMDDA